MLIINSWRGRTEFYRKKYDLSFVHLKSDGEVFCRYIHYNNKYCNENSEISVLAR